LPRAGSAGGASQRDILILAAVLLILVLTLLGWSAVDANLLKIY
jgi:hypothetical protein